MCKICRSSRSLQNSDILSSLPDDLVFRILDCLSLPERLLLSVVCKQWRELCAAGINDFDITVRDMQQLIDAHVWLAKFLDGRQSAVKKLRILCLDCGFLSAPSAYLREGPPNPLLDLKGPSSWEASVTYKFWWDCTSCTWITLYPPSWSLCPEIVALSSVEQHKLILSWNRIYTSLPSLMRCWRYLRVFLLAERSIYFPEHNLKLITQVTPSFCSPDCISVDNFFNICSCTICSGSQIVTIPQHWHDQKCTVT